MFCGWKPIAGSSQKRDANLLEPDDAHKDDGVSGISVRQETTAYCCDSAASFMQCSAESRLETLECAEYPDVCNQLGCAG